MRLYPKVIPIISRESIQRLMQDGDIEVEPLRIADAEMDMSAIMREYLANEERVNQATREALERRGYDYSKFNQVKREMADVRGFKMGDEGIEFVINQMIEFLLISRNIEEAFGALALLAWSVHGVQGGAHCAQVDRSHCHQGQPRLVVGDPDVYLPALPG